jgi:hypothetical protein
VRKFLLNTIYKLKAAQYLNVNEKMGVSTLHNTAGSQLPADLADSCLETWVTAAYRPEQQLLADLAKSYLETRIIDCLQT